VLEFLTSWQAVTDAWIVFVVFWVFSALRRKRTAKREDLPGRSVHILFMVVAYSLLFKRSLYLGPLSGRYLPPDQRIEIAGVLMVWLGVAVAIWARVHIGQYWSGLITLKEDHKLIRSGPYAYVRHPIYTGLLLATFGTALVQGKWQGLLGAAIILIAHIRKARKEEALMTSQFGERYREYRRHSGFLIPRLH